MRPVYGFPHVYNHAHYHELYCLAEVSEAQVMKDVLSLLHLYQVDAAAVDAGGSRARGRLIAAAKHRGIDIGDLPKITTPDIPKGWADIEGTLAPDGRGLFIEVKRPRWVNECGRTIRQEGRPSIEQLDWLQEKQTRGALVMIAWSADDVEIYLSDELRRNRRALRERTTSIHFNCAGNRGPETR
jgi:hypothetical protein